MKKIILTGGGSGGHVTPNLALVPRLKKLNFDILYIGSKEGIERKLVTDAGIRYESISTGKLRRYFDLKNFTDPFRVIKGYFDASKIIKNFKPDVIFSKGGFVSVPVVYAAKRYKIPIILHESDISPGLANKLSAPAATKICCNFPETLKSLPEEKRVLSGSPIREELSKGSRAEGLKVLGFDGLKPVLLVIGGSLGSENINHAVRSALTMLFGIFDIVHITGKGNVDNSLIKTKGYVQLEYVEKELKDIFAATDICISRAGANAICELLYLNKPTLLIPLSAKASRGDQVLNAESFEKQGFSKVLLEENLDAQNLFNNVMDVWKDKDRYIKVMKSARVSNGVDVIVGLIEEAAAGKV